MTLTLQPPSVTLPIDVATARSWAPKPNGHEPLASLRFKLVPSLSPCTGSRLPGLTKCSLRVVTEVCMSHQSSGDLEISSDDEAKQMRTIMHTCIHAYMHTCIYAPDSLSPHVSPTSLLQCNRQAPRLRAGVPGRPRFWRTRGRTPVP